MGITRGYTVPAPPCEPRWAYGGSWHLADMLIALT
jgi:hypothetical protein